ncbi:hypothetical protein AGLY_005267 [Aphis glycines]|uniref:Uncharacterized protein n=1 Tax=Aphis glycines TaxID=307491 RepID=A0A6G0TW82_APHGL|nr:hypothetical protein AGLY_005267 [Aphis glycines]
MPVHHIGVKSTWWQYRQQVFRTDQDYWFDFVRSEVHGVYQFVNGASTSTPDEYYCVVFRSMDSITNDITGFIVDCNEVTFVVRFSRSCVVTVYNYINKQTNTTYNIFTQYESLCKTHNLIERIPIEEQVEFIYKQNVCQNMKNNFKLRPTYYKISEYLGILSVLTLNNLVLQFIIHGHSFVRTVLLRSTNINILLKSYILKLKWLNFRTRNGYEHNEICKWLGQYENKLKTCGTYNL